MYYNKVSTLYAKSNLKYQTPKPYASENFFWDTIWYYTVKIILYQLKNTVFLNLQTLSRKHITKYCKFCCVLSRWSRVENKSVVFWGGSSINFITNSYNHFSGVVKLINYWLIKNIRFTWAMKNHNVIILLIYIIKWLCDLFMSNFH